MVTATIHAPVWVAGTPQDPAQPAPALVVLPDASSFFIPVDEEVENLLNGRTLVVAEVEIEGDQMTIIREAPSQPS